MSTPIPEDVMRAAKAACDAHGIPAMGVPFVPSDACRVAMTAIMAEREACAVAAEKCGSRAEQFMKERLESHSIDFQRFAEGCASAASAIRDRSKT